MYSKRPNIVLGFHGCDEKVRDEVVSLEGVVLQNSQNKYDWLGNGVYFWENNYKRALEFATEQMHNPRKGKQNITSPSVVGAIIDLGYCLDLLDSANFELLKIAYNRLIKINKEQGLLLPENKKSVTGNDLLLRYLDCAVIETLHLFNKENPRHEEFDSVRGMFLEGDELYPNAGFKEKNHIQIAIKNPNCIKGYFIPRKLNSKYLNP